MARVLTGHWSAGPLDQRSTRQEVSVLAAHGIVAARFEPAYSATRPSLTALGNHEDGAITRTRTTPDAPTPVRSAGRRNGGWRELASQILRSELTGLSGLVETIAE
jgi:hypothetical protein